MSATFLLAIRILMVICLYAVLGWIFFTIWQTVRQQGLLLAARKAPPLTLIIQTGAQPAFSRRFAQTEVVLGRDPDCEAPLPDETASARHARLSYHHGQWWLEDLDSTNGTRLNNMPVETPTVVISDDQITCGQTTATIKLTGKVLN